MNRNIKELIRAVACNDIKKAKKCVQIICDGDKTQSNESFCNDIKAKLQATMLNLVEVPSNISGLLLVEDLQQSFRAERYLLTVREAELYKKIAAVHKAAQKLAEMDISYINAVMLYGGSGTGKTMFGRYVAWKLGLPFAYLKFSHLMDSHLGKTGRNINAVFDYVESFPCVLMLDEIDAVGSKRGLRFDVAEMSRVVISLMQAFDKMQNNALVIGATNRLDILDEALLRRFPIKHEVIALSAFERKKAVERFLIDVKIPADEAEIMAFCKEEKAVAQVINELIQRIAESVINETPLNLKKQKEESNYVMQ